MIEGPGTVVKCLDEHIVVRLGDDHPDRPGQYVMVGPREVQG
jgi:NAD(P)H-flavin reductase